MYFRRLALGLSLLSSLLVTSKVQASSLVEEFTIKPSLCIVEAGKACKQSFIFYWRLKQATTACVYKRASDTALHCEDKKEVSVTLFMDLKLSDKFTLQVEDRHSHQDILVRQLTRDVRQVRRHVWSVF